jgi:hypothetical protein
MFQGLFHSSKGCRLFPLLGAFETSSEALNIMMMLMDVVMQDELHQLYQKAFVGVSKVGEIAR